MGWITDAWYWIAAKDPALDADQKLSRWTNLTTAAGVIVSAVGWIVGLLLNIPWQLGLLSGLAAWVVLLNTVVARGRGEVRKTEATSAEELEQVTARLREVEQERDDLRTENKHLTDQSGEELKQRALRLSSELFRFAQEREKHAPPEATPQMSGGFWNTIMESANDPKTQERNTYDDETKYCTLSGTGATWGPCWILYNGASGLIPKSARGLRKSLLIPLRFSLRHRLYGRQHSV